MTWVSSRLTRWRTTRAVRILVREAGGRGNVSFCAHSTFPFVASTRMPSSTPSGAGSGSPPGELQQGRVEVLAAQACRCEQVADPFDALEGGCDGELLGQDLLLKLLPRQRHRHRGPRVGPDRVRGDEGLALGVLVGVDE